jgi:putative transposase
VAGFVLMDNHYHLLVLSPHENIDRIMYFFMKRLSFQIRKESGRINRIFGARYKGCLIKDETYLFNVYKYIYRNPVKAGLCDRIEEYPYSSWKESFVQIETLFFPVKKSLGELRWLNCDFEKSQSEGIQRSLKRTVFEVPQTWQPLQISHFV